METAPARPTGLSPSFAPSACAQSSIMRFPATVRRSTGNPNICGTIVMSALHRSNASRAMFGLFLSVSRRMGVAPASAIALVSALQAYTGQPTSQPGASRTHNERKSAAVPLETATAWPSARPRKAQSSFSNVVPAIPIRLRVWLLHSPRSSGLADCGGSLFLKNGRSDAHHDCLTVACNRAR